MARNRLKSSLYLIKQRRRRKEYPVLADEISHDALQGFKVQSESVQVKNKQKHIISEIVFLTNV